MLAAEDDSLRQFAEESKTGRAGKTLVKDGPLRITLVALKKGTELPSHHVEEPYQYPDYSWLPKAHDREGRSGCFDRQPHSLGSRCCSRGQGA